MEFLERKRCTETVAPVAADGGTRGTTGAIAHEDHRTREAAGTARLYDPLLRMLM